LYIINLYLGIVAKTAPALQEDLADWLNEESGAFDDVNDVSVFFNFKQADGKSMPFSLLYRLFNMLFYTLLMK
jgi:hypothetical protein